VTHISSEICTTCKNCPNSKKTNSYTEKKYQQKNNDNSPSNRCEVKWYNYLVVLEMIPLKKYEANCEAKISC